MGKRFKENFMKYRLILIWTFCVLLNYPSSVSAGNQTVLVAAASSMKFAFDEIIDAFRVEQPEIDIKVSFGSSGNFFSQISHGAPYDAYFSADHDYPQKLKEGGHADNNSEVTPYAVGSLVLWVPNHIPVKVMEEKIHTLLNPVIKKIAIANPRHAPYGRAAIECLKNLEVYSAAQSRLVMGENITQAAQFTQTGAAQAGIIALSLALTEKMQASGTYWEIPEDTYSPIQQSFLLLKTGKNRHGAETFSRFVMGPMGRAVLHRYGFKPPEAAKP